VRAVPSSVEQKVASAVERFNSSEHPHTVAGVARSLGMPAVSVRPSDARPSVVNVVVSWELYWYRYEADLSDDRPRVRVAGQGNELDELPPEERQPNAAADERGALGIASEPHTAEGLCGRRGDLGGGGVRYEPRSGGVSAGRGVWPRGTFRFRARASGARLEAPAGLCALRLLEVPPWPRSQAYSPIM
jgi:hypothetical protein